MTLRHLVLAAAAVLVFGMGIYLMVEVRAKPAAAEAQAMPRPSVSHQDTTPEESDHPTPTATESSKQSTRSPFANNLVRNPRAETGKIAGEKAADPDFNLDTVMAEANQAYDRLEFDEARAIAQKVLKKVPGNTRMLRILVSAACIETDGPEAQKHYNLLPISDREQMRTRCSKYGVTFTEPPAVLIHMPQ